MQTESERKVAKSDKWISFWRLPQAILTVSIVTYLVAITAERVWLANSGYVGGALVLSADQADLEPNYHALATTLPIVVAVDATQKAKFLSIQAADLSGAPVPPPFILLDGTNRRGIRVLQGNDGVSLGLSLISQSSEAMHRSVIPVFVSFAAIGLAAFLWKSVGLDILLALFCALMAALRYYSRCTSCPDIVPTGIGVDLSLLGGAAYLCISAFISRGFRSIASALFSVMASYQLYLFFTYGAGCIFCLIMLTASVISVFRLATPKFKTEEYTRHSRASKLVNPVFVTGFALVVFLFGAGAVKVTAKSSHPQTADKHSEAKSLIGSSWKDLKITGTQPAKPPFVLLVGSPDCQACRLAMRWCVKNLTIPLHLVSRFRRDDSLIGKASESWLTDPTILASTPCLIGVNGEGTIVSVEEGWIESIAFQLELKKKLSFAPLPVRNGGSD